ncbi:MAG: DegV family protein [Eubacteriales bacterium]|jgi:DegV family protein with EDD domain
MGITIITDSTAEILPAEAKSRNLVVLPIKTVFEDGVYRDGVDLMPEEFYEKQASAKTLPSTTQPSPFEFEELFSEAVNRGDSVIALLIAGTLSGTVQSANMAKSNIEGEIYVIDSECTTVSLRLLVEHALELREKGCSAVEIVTAVEKAKKRIKLFAYVDTLEYLKKGGRISKTAAFAGSLLDVKPLIYLRDGELGVKSKVRGLKNAQKEVIRLAQEDGIDTEMPVALGYSGSRETFEQFNELAVNTIGKIDSVSAIGSVIGAHVGPGAGAIAYFKKEE